MLTTFSHSALQTFAQCRRKFQFRYLERPEIPKRISAEAYLGTAVHTVLQALYERGADGVELSLEAALEIYERAWREVDRALLAVVTEHMGIDDYIRIGREILARHHERYRPFRPGALLGAELHLHFTLPGTPYRLSARIDRLWRRDDGTVEICDYKTGKNLSRPHDLDYFHQMGLYQLAVMANYPQYRDIEAAQYCLRMDEVVAHRFRPDDLELLVENIRQQILAIHEADRLSQFPTRESSLCNWCEYAALCPAKRHKLLIEAGEADRDGALRRAYAKATEYIARYAAVKELEAEMAALRADLVRLAGELQMTKFSGEGGEVAVGITEEEKFVTKTDSSTDFASLTALARDAGLIEYFKLDSAALMKDGYAKGLLPAALSAELKKFIRRKQTVTLRVKLARAGEDPDAPSGSL